MHAASLALKKKLSLIWDFLLLLKTKGLLRVQSVNYGFHVAGKMQRLTEQFGCPFKE